MKSLLIPILKNQLSLKNDEIIQWKIVLYTNNDNLKLIINLNVRSKIMQLLGVNSIFVITLGNDFLEKTKKHKTRV